MINEIPLLKLIGDEQENFYQLGLKDREKCHELIEHINQLTDSSWKSINAIIKGLAQSIVTNDRYIDLNFKKNISAYSEGLNRNWDEVAFSILLPEIISCMDKWINPIGKYLMGCSSYFCWDDDYDSPIHGRILDFSLLETFDKNERAIIHDSNNGPKIFSFGTVGLPYPSLTAMSDQGVTLAIHQKFNSHFDPAGTPIFDLAYQVLKNCSSSKETIKFLSDKNPVTTWALYMSFSNGDILRADLSPNNFFYNQSKIIPGKVLYFNNLLEDKTINQKEISPYGMYHFCQMRKKIANKQILSLQKSKIRNDLKLLQEISTPFQSKKVQSKNWALSPLTFNSLSCSTFNAVEGRALYVTGEAPKIYQGQYQEFTNIWTSPDSKIKNKKFKKLDSKFEKAYRSLAKTQTAIDKKEFTMAYHHIQMSIYNFEGYPEYNIAKFFFLILQFIHEPEKQLHHNILEEFKNLKDHIPSYLRDHCLLFISRLEKILAINCSVSISDFENLKLKEIFERERKIPRLIFHKTISKLMTIRFDILDIIYSHV